MGLSPRVSYQCARTVEAMRAVLRRCPARVVLGAPLRCKPYHSHFSYIPLRLVPCRWLGNLEKNLKAAGGTYFAGEKVGFSVRYVLTCGTAVNLHSLILRKTRYVLCLS